ncbi:RHS repeat-associated core domain-containing protein, partial [bacterium]|nr:RHS repeat-associated core domain-containing protein [bacterium]
YEAFGKEVVENGEGERRHGSAFGNPYRFQGRWKDFEEGSPLVYFRARYYDPETGRFTSRDPIGILGGINLYGFCGNNGGANISCGKQERRGDSAYAVVWVTVVREQCSTKGLVEDRLVKEIAAEKSGWTFFPTTEAAKAWERRLASIAPKMARDLAVEKGPEVLERTAAARDAVARYLRFLGGFESPWQARAALSTDMSDADQREAARLAEFAGVLKVRGAGDQYAAACTAIVKHAATVEETPMPFRGVSPLDERNLMWRIQLLTDALMHQWPLSPGEGE